MEQPGTCTAVMLLLDRSRRVTAGSSVRLASMAGRQLFEQVRLVSCGHAAASRRPAHARMLHCLHATVAASNADSQKAHKVAWDVNGPAVVHLHTSCRLGCRRARAQAILGKIIQHTHIVLACIIKQQNCQEYFLCGRED